MTGSFTIHGRLAGLNEIITAARGDMGWFKSAGQKKKMTRLCAQSIVFQRVPVFERPVAVSIRWVEPNRRRDLDNIQAGAKFILDALTQTRRIPNDSRRWVRALRHEMPEPDPKNPRIEVFLEAYE